MRRMLVAAAVASLSFASFAGCSDDSSQQATPTSSPSASAARCAPSTAVIAWDAGSSADEPLLVAAYSLTYRGGGAWAADFADVAVPTNWDDSQLTRIARSSAQVESWHRQLLASANRTGQVGTQFGAPVSIDQDGVPPATPSKPSSHEFVVTVVERPYTMPYTIRCGGGIGTIAGSVTAPRGDGLLTAIYDCTLPARSSAARDALAYCS